MTEKRCPQQKTWDDYPPKKVDGKWHCRKCDVVLTGRKRSWCSRDCEKAVLLEVHWPYIRACILRRDRWKCQMVHADGTRCLRPAHEVDHIIELADGGSYHEWSNLRAVCEDCHKKKTIVMRSARAVRKREVKKKASIAEKVKAFTETTVLKE